MCGKCVVDTFTLTCSRHLAKHIANALMHSGRRLSNTNEVQDIWGINQRLTCLAVVLLVISSNTDVNALIYSVSLGNCWHPMVFERHQTSQALETFILRCLLLLRASSKIV
jgi:hypothetical protein